MIAQHMTYTRENGSRMEVAGYGLTLADARQDAVNRAKAAISDEPFVLARIAGAACDASAERTARNAAIGSRFYFEALL